MSQDDTLTLREALRSIQYEAISLADAQVIALQALNATYPARAALSATQPAQAAQSTHWTENEPVRLAPSRVGRVYVAGPMTGIADFNFPAFNAEAGALRAQGLSVLNPADHGIVAGANWADYLRHDIAGLASCERIHLLRGWSKSKGAQLEVTIANALGMVITYQDGAETAQAEQGEPLCDDEGCDHHGTPHVCVNNKQPAQGAGEVVAWCTPDGERCVTARTYEGARKDGGAMWSSMVPFTVPAYTQPAAGADVLKNAARYEWLRAQDNEDFAFAVVKNPHFDVYDSPEELDADIDAAIAASGRQ